MEFAKLQALGNDFVIVEARSVPPGTRLDKLAKSLCDRHYGAGADGLIVVLEASPDDDVACSSRIFNADGGEAEVSGNGTRCVAAYLEAMERWPASLDSVHIRTVAGVKVVRRTETPRVFEMEMGVPRLGSRDVPMMVEPPLDPIVGYRLDLGDESRRVTVTSIGNPHCTIFVERLDLDEVRALGPRVERHPSFPNRTNVEFVEVVDHDRLRARFWERGAGETLSSGTGSSAALVAAVLNGFTGRTVTVETPAGSLRATWRETDDVVLLAGPAELVYSGIWPRRA